MEREPALHFARANQHQQANVDYDPESNAPLAPFTDLVGGPLCSQARDNARETCATTV